MFHRRRILNELDDNHERLLQAIENEDQDQAKIIIKKLKANDRLSSDDYFLKALEIKSINMVKLVFEYQGENYLRNALDAEFVEAVDFLVSQGGELLVNDRYPWSAFVYCIEHEKLNILKHILTLPELNYPYSHLCHAAMTRNPDILSKCLEYPELRKLVNRECTINGKAFTPLHWCLDVNSSFCNPSRETGCVKLLIEAGADINICCENVSPILRAAMHHDATLVLYLLENGAELAKDKQKLNLVFHFLLESRRGVEYDPEEDVTFQCINRLLEIGADPCTPNEDGKMPLILSAENNKNIFEKLLNFYCDNNTDAKCNLSASSGKNQTSILHIMAEKYFDRLDLIEKVLKTGYDVNITDSESLTPLSIAALYLNSDVVRLLLKYDANINACDTRGRNAAYYCLASEFERNRHKKLELLSFLCEEGIHLDKNLYLPALEYGKTDCIEFLIQRGVDTNNIKQDFDGILMNIVNLGYDTRFKDKTYDMMVKSVEDINENIYGRTPLESAAEYNNETLLKVLLRNGCDVVSTGSKVLDLMARRNRYFSVKELLKAGIEVGQIALNRIKDEYCLALLLKNGGEHLIETKYEDGSLISSKLYSLVEGEESVIFTLLTYNCSLRDLYNDSIGVMPYFQDSDNFDLADILYQSGAPKDELMKCIGDELKTQLEKETAEYSLKCRCRRIIRQCLGLGINQKLDDVGIPEALQDYVLLKDTLHDDYFTRGEINDEYDEDEDDDNDDEDDLDEDDEDDL